MKVKVDEKTGEVVRDLGETKAPDPMGGGFVAATPETGDVIEGWRAIRYSPPDKIGRFDSKPPEWLEARLQSADALPCWFGCYSNVAFGAHDELGLTFQVAYPTTATTSTGVMVVGSWAQELPEDTRNFWIPGRIENVPTSKIRSVLAKIGSAVLHRPNPRGNAEWWRVDFHKAMMARLLRVKISGKPFAPKDDEEMNAWAFISSLRLEEVYEALNFAVKTGPQEAVEGDVYVGNFCYMLIAPEGMQYSRAMKAWRPVGFGPGSLPNACPPSLVKWTPAIRATYQSVLDENDKAAVANYVVTNKGPYENANKEWNGAPTTSTRLLRAPLRIT